jgi:hypothetical protein
MMGGYKNWSIFLKFDENRWNLVGSNFKTAENTVHYFKIPEKNKNQQKN